MLWKYRRVFDLRYLPRGKRSQARTVLTRPTPGFDWRVLLPALNGERIWLKVDPKVGVNTGYAFFPTTNRSGFNAPPGYGLIVGAWDANSALHHAKVWHELGHMVDFIHMTVDLRNRITTAMCAHSPTHSWLSPSTPYADRVGEAYAHAFQQTFAPALGPPPGGWPHPMTDPNVHVLIRELEK